MSSLDTLEIKDKVQSIADALFEELPGNSAESHAVLPASEIEFARTHKFREVTTRRHCPGVHSVSLRINGVDTPRVDFTLTGAG